MKRRNRPISVEELKKKRLVEYEKILQQKIDDNKKIFDRNESEFIPKAKKMIDRLNTYFRFEEERLNIRLSGLKVIRPTFEFEASEEFEDWNRRVALQALEDLKEEKANKIAEAEKSLETLEEQQTRILTEKPQLEEKIRAVREGEIEVSEQEILDMSESIQE